MVAAPHPDGLTAVPVRRVLTRRWSRAQRRMRASEAPWVLTLGLLTLVLAGLFAVAPDSLTVTIIIIPLVVANLVLSPRSLPWFVVFALSVLVLVTATTVSTSTFDARRISGVVITFVIGLIILFASFRRSRLGVSGGMGESMLVDLRDRISSQGRLPRLPGDWYAEAVMRSAGGSSFAGDFMVAARSQDQRLLQVVVVDVSGKGEQAGT
ncbi:MAG: PP2C family protein-serine/threonine phosphatase, partial [Nocardioidaceae bacterium]